MVGPFDIFLIVFHTLRLFCVIFLYHSANQLFPDSMFCVKRVAFNDCSCMLHIDFLIGQFRNVICSTSSWYAYDRC